MHQMSNARQKPNPPRRAGARQKSMIHIHYHNRTKVLLIYLVCWGVAALVPLAGLWWLYPNKLAGSAPLLSQNLMEWMRQFPQLPFLPFSDTLRGALDTVLAGAAVQGDALEQYLAARDLIWQSVASLLGILAWALTLLFQLIWRVFSGRSALTQKKAKRAVHRYHLYMLFLWLLNGLFVAALHLVGMGAIRNFGVWDLLVYTNGYLLNLLAAILCFRNAAPSSISGRQAFFRRW